MKVKNDGDEDIFFVTVQGIQHPTAQVGDETDTFAATEIALSQNGNFETSKDLGTLSPAEAVSVWVRWVIPEEAPAGDVVWALEALGQET